MTLQQLRDAAATALAEAIAERKRHQDTLVALRSAVGTDESVTAERVDGAIAERDAADAKVDAAQKRLADLDAEIKRDAEMEELSRQAIPTQARAPRYDEVARVGSEERTYRQDADPKGERFLRDVAAAFVMRDFTATDRLSRHVREEMVERGADFAERATGTGAFAGLTVPQYLVDAFAPVAKAGRPFANICRPHDLPDTGMTVSIGRGTTGTDTGLQASEGAAVTEQDFDDTLLTFNVQTNAGQQTMSRQAVARSVGALDVTVEDLIRSYHTRLDATLITQATTGLSAAATSVAYTDGTPTVAELYPKFQEALSGVETSMLDQSLPDDLVAVMHTRRWRWMNAGTTTSWPLIQQPGIPTQNGGVNYGTVYGSGFRGLLPDGTPVVVDNNIATNGGVGTNEDEIYFVARSECHLWEDPNAPLFIRAEETKAANLQVLLVVYGFFAYTFGRRPHARKIAGTGLVAPTF